MKLLRQKTLVHPIGQRKSLHVGIQPFLPTIMEYLVKALEAGVKGFPLPAELLRQKNLKGFTIIEMMVVIGIIGILASIAVPNYASYIKRARAAQCLANRHHIEMEQYSSDALAYNTGHEQMDRNLQCDGLSGNMADILRVLTDRPAYAATHVDRKAKPANVFPKIDERWKCPSGGTYLWVKNPNNPDCPRVVCSIHGGAIPSPPGQGKDKVLFSTDFDDMDNTTPLRGKWKIRDGALVPTGKGEHRLAFGDKTWKDYELNVNATLSKGKGYGIYYRADGVRKISGYCFQYDPGYGRGAFLVRKVINGRERRPFQRVKIPKDFPVYNRSHEITISVQGDDHVIKVDGEVILDFKDDDKPFTSGSAGFRSWGRSRVSFQNITVSELD